MELFYLPVLIVHILAGIGSLISGFFAMTSVKGSRLHRRSGLGFFYSMSLLCVSAVLLTFIHPNLFLFHISIFAFYQNYAGYRAVKSKALQYSWKDLLNLITGSINSLIMVCSFNIVLTIFGTIGILITSRHWMGIWSEYKAKVAPFNWLKMHIGMMIGAYISAITAFLVVNMHALTSFGLPPLFIWTLPSIVLGPLASYWTWKYTSEKTKRVA